MRARSELLCREERMGQHPTTVQSQRPICFSSHLYRARNLVAPFFNKIKHCRRVATRYDKLAANYLAFVQHASIRLWLRVNESTSQSRLRRWGRSSIARQLRCNGRRLMSTCPIIPSSHSSSGRISSMLHRGPRQHQEAMNALPIAQDEALRHLEKSGVQCACGPKLNKKERLSLVRQSAPAPSIW